MSAGLTEFVAVDVETTGFGSEARVVEVAAVLYRHQVGLDPACPGAPVVHFWAEADQFSTLVNPGVPIPPEATAVHGITDEMVADARSFDAVALELLAFIGDRDLVAHNARFDRAMIDQELARIGRSRLVNGSRCTLRLAQDQLSLRSYKLGSVVAHLGVVVEGTAHRALADALAAGRAFVKLIEASA